MPAEPAVRAFGPPRNAAQYTDAASQTYKQGAAVVLNGSQLLAECGADPAAILGFAQHAAGTDPMGSTVAHVERATEGQYFWMDGTSAPAASDVGVAYGIVKDADGIWVVDKTDTSNTRVSVVNVDLERSRFLVSVLAANRQLAL